MAGRREEDVVLGASSINVSTADAFKSWSQITKALYRCEASERDLGYRVNEAMGG